MEESELYGPIMNWIQGEFRPSLEGRAGCVFNHVALDVSLLGWFEGEGLWMRPDLAFVHVYRRTFDPQSTLDLHTFEVKAGQGDLLPALHQTIAHGRFADFVYLIAPATRRWTAELVSQAERFGVGLIRFSDVEDFRTFEFLAKPSRCSPQLDLRNQFLEIALTHSNQKAQVVGWLRR